MRKLALVVALAALPTLASCSFLLDFNSLQGGATDGGAGSGGSGGSAGATADSGGPCASGCDDGDPCTRDVCDTSGAAPACKHFSNGAVVDGLDASVQAPIVLRTTLAGNDTGFYGSIFTTDKTNTDVALIRFGKTDTSLTPGPKYSDFAFLELKSHMPVSAVGLLATKELPYSVLGYMAIDQGQASPGKVYRLTLDKNLVPTAIKAASLATDFAQDSAFTRHPEAWENSSGDTFGAWIGADNLLHVDSSVAAVTLTLGDTGNPAPITAFAPLTNVGGAPGAVWFADRPYAQIRGNAPTLLGFCDSHPSGIYLSASSAPLPVAGSWALVSTRTDASLSYLATEGHVISCDATKCGLESNPCATPPDPISFAPSIATATRQSEPGILYEAEAVPTLDTTAKQTVIRLYIIRIDLDKLLSGVTQNAIYSLTPASGIEVARAGSGTSKAPNWPALAVSGGDRIGISWQQPDQSGANELAHFRRYRMCFPTPDDVAAAQSDGGA